MTGGARVRAVVRLRVKLWVVASRAHAPAVVRLQVKLWTGLPEVVPRRVPARASVRSPVKAAQLRVL